MALGIAAVVALHGLRATVAANVEARSQSLLGADVRLESRAPLDEAARDRVDALSRTDGAAVAHVTRFGSMALTPRSGRTRLVDVQGIEGGFPFYGEVRTDPPDLWNTLGAEEPIALVDPSLLVQLDAAVGDELTLGEARFRIAGAVVRAPGTVGMRSQVAPRVFIARGFVPDTRLVQLGSLVEYQVYLRAREEALVPWLEEHETPLESARVEVETVEGFQEDLTRSFATLTSYLGLVGLAALALGGVGVAAGVRVLVREKLGTVAVLRAVGASSTDVLAAYGLLALALGAGAGLAGAGLGVALQAWLPLLLEAFLPVRVETSIDPVTLAIGIALGLWLTTLFAAGPLLDLGRVPPLRALRRDFSAERAEQPGRRALIAALAVTLSAASFWQAPSWKLGLAFAGGLGVVFAVLAAASLGATSWLKHHRLRGAPWWLRQGVSNLFRPRNHTLATVLSVGFGLFVVSTLVTVRENVMRQIAVDTREDRPNLVLFDVQSDQVAPLEAFAASQGAALIEQAPIVSARIASVAGVEVSASLADDTLERDRRWALGREYRATYADALRETERVAAGRWWHVDDTNEPVAVSLEAGIAEVLDLDVGGSITWDVQGVRVASTVRSVREVDWGRLATNFFAIFPPGVLEDAPQSAVFLLRLPGEAARAAFQRDLVERFPNVSALDATVILRAMDAMLREIGFAVRLLALFTLATGIAILVAAAATARHERTREALLLRTLGASGQTVVRIVATEAFALGGLAAVVGSVLAIAASWALIRFVFELPFSPPWIELGGLALGTFLVSGGLGWWSGRPARKQSPLAALREAELSGAGAG